MFTINVKENNAVKKSAAPQKPWQQKCLSLLCGRRMCKSVGVMMSTAPLTMPSDRFRPTIFWLLFD